MSVTPVTPAARVATSSIKPNKNCVCRAWDAMRATIVGIFRNLIRKPADMEKVVGGNLHQREIRQYGKNLFTAIKIDSFTANQMASMGKTQVNYWLQKDDQILEAAPRLQTSQLLHVFHKAEANRWDQIVSRLSAPQIEDLLVLSENPSQTRLKQSLENILFGDVESAAWEQLQAGTSNNFIQHMVFKSDPAVVTAQKIAALAPQRLAAVIEPMQTSLIPTDILTKLSAEQIVEILPIPRYIEEINQHVSLETKAEVVEILLNRCPSLNLEQFHFLLSFMGDHPGEVLKQITAQQFSNCLDQDQYGKYQELPPLFQENLKTAVSQLNAAEWKRLWDELGSVPRYPLAESCLVLNGKQEFFESLFHSQNAGEDSATSGLRLFRLAANLLCENNQDGCLAEQPMLEEYLRHIVMDQFEAIILDQQVAFHVRSFVFDQIIADYILNRNTAIAIRLSQLMQDIESQPLMEAEKYGCESTELLWSNLYCLFIAADDVPISLLDSMLGNISEETKQFFQLISAMDDKTDSKISSNKMKLLPYFGGEVFNNFETPQELIACASTMTPGQLSGVLSTQMSFPNECLVDYASAILRDSNIPRMYEKMTRYLGWIKARVQKDIVYLILLVNRAEMQKNPAVLFHFLTAYLDTQSTESRRFSNNPSSGLAVNDKFIYFTSEIVRFFDNNLFFPSGEQHSSHLFTHVIGGILGVITERRLSIENQQGHRDLGFVLFENFVFHLMQQGISPDILLYDYFAHVGVDKLLNELESANRVNATDKPLEKLSSIFGSTFFNSFIYTALEHFGYSVLPIEKSRIENKVFRLVRVANVQKANEGGAITQDVHREANLIKTEIEQVERTEQEVTRTATVYLDYLRRFKLLYKKSRKKLPSALSILEEKLNKCVKLHSGNWSRAHIDKINGLQGTSAVQTE